MIIHVGNTGNVGCDLDDWPYSACKFVLKGRCLVVSSWWQKQHFLLPFQLLRARLSFATATLRQRYHIFFLLTLSCIFDFQIMLLLPTGTSECVSARYIVYCKHPALRSALRQVDQIHAAMKCWIIKQFLWVPAHIGPTPSSSYTWFQFTMNLCGRRFCYCLCELVLTMCILVMTTKVASTD